MKKRFVSILLSFSTVMFCFSFVSFDAVAETAPFKGSGTDTDPYQIASAADLFKLAELIDNTETTETYTDKSYIQTKDIDLENNSFIPIGQYNPNNTPFKGKYNGNYHLIDNLYVDYTVATNGGYIGLFGIVWGGTICNLNVNGSVKGTINAGNYTQCGGIVGELCENASMSDCSFNGSVSGNKNNVGGLVGQIIRGGSISSCYFNGSVMSGGEQCGGIVGNLADQSRETSLSVENCYAVGTITASTNFGGVIGNSKHDNEKTVFTVQNNYYLVDMCEKGTNGIVTTGCTKLSATALKACADMLGSPFVDNHEADNFNDGYPIFEWQSTPYQFKGSGTIADPYQISSKEELEYMRDLVNSSYFNYIYGNANYIQTADIDLENELWKPIGWGRDGDDGQGEYNWKNKMFYGSYNGNNHSIFNLNIQRKWGTVGFFGYIRGSKASLRNLIVYGTVADVSEDNAYEVGGIVGEVQYSARLESCAFIGNVTAKSEANYVGGIVGQVWAADTVKNCYHNGNVIGGKYAGGITGMVAFHATNNKDGDSSLIENCYQTNGSVEGSLRSGAIVGYCAFNEGVDNKTDIINCYATQDANAPAKECAATSDNTMLITKGSLKQSAEDLGAEFVTNPTDQLNDGYPVFYWQIAMGDMNLDGELGVADAILLQRYLLCSLKKNISYGQFKLADMNGDNKLNAVDLTLLKRMLLNM